MILIFWFLCACMLVIALAFVALPLFRHQHDEQAGNRRELNIQVRKDHLRELEREKELSNIDEGEFENARRELEVALLADLDNSEDIDTTARGISLSGTLLSVALILPLIVIGIYLQLGDLKMLATGAIEQTVQEDQETMHSLEEVVKNLETRLQARPDNGEDWVMLARSYLVMSRPADAVAAYQQARSLIGDDSRLLADYSEALIFANNNHINQEIEDLVNLSLAQNPDEPKSLWIAGYASMEKGNTRKALAHWEKLLVLLPANSNESNSLLEKIKELRKRSDMEPAPIAGIVARTTEISQAAEADGVSSIEVQVKLDPSLKEQANSEDILYVFARAAEGPRLPLAIARLNAKDLPATVTLEDSMAMTPTLSLSKFNQVVIGARISKSGEAMPKTGDLEGKSNVIQLDEVTGIKITIDRIIP